MSLFLWVPPIHGNKNFMMGIFVDYNCKEFIISFRIEYLNKCYRWLSILYNVSRKNLEFQKKEKQEILFWGLLTDNNFFVDFFVKKKDTDSLWFLLLSKKDCYLKVSAIYTCQLYYSIWKIQVTDAMNNSIEI